jgi:hypothetical protein
VGQQQVLQVVLVTIHGFRLLRQCWQRVGLEVDLPTMPLGPVPVSVAVRLAVVLETRNTAEETAYRMSAPSVAAVAVRLALVQMVETR